MLPILMAVIVWIPPLIGLGAIFEWMHGAHFRDYSIKDLGLSGIFGLFVASVAATIWNFFLAVPPALPVCLFILGWGIFLALHRATVTRLKGRTIGAIGFIVLLVCLVSSRGKSGYDTGLYHLQAVQWISAAPVPLGLANLHGRLGFNSAWFPTAAALELPLLAGKSTFIVIPIFFVFSGMLIRQSVEKAILGQADRADLFKLCLCFPWFYYGSMHASSLYPDAPAVLLTLIAAALWLEESDRSTNLRRLMTVAIYALTIKLPALPLFLFSAIGLVSGLRFDRRFVALAAVWLLVLITWAGRSVLLSGYPFYPFTAGKFVNAEWVVPAARVDYELACVQSWARYRTMPAKIPSTSWVGPFLIKLFKLPSMIVGASVLVCGMLLLIFSPRARFGPIWASLLFASGVGIVAWWINAPDPRFGYGYIYAFSAGIFCIGIRQAADGLSRFIDYQKWLATTASAVVCIGFLANGFGKNTWRHWPTIPHNIIIKQTTNDGTIVYVPENDDRAFAAPLPSTYRLDPTLRCIKDANGRFVKFLPGTSTELIP